MSRRTLPSGCSRWGPWWCFATRWRTLSPLQNCASVAFPAKRRNDSSATWHHESLWTAVADGFTVVLNPLPAELCRSTQALSARQPQPLRHLQPDRGSPPLHRKAKLDSCRARRQENDTGTNIVHASLSAAPRGSLEALTEPLPPASATDRVGSGEQRAKHHALMPIEVPQQHEEHVGARQNRAEEHAQERQQRRLTQNCAEHACVLKDTERQRSLQAWRVCTCT